MCSGRWGGGGREGGLGRGRGRVVGGRGVGGRGGGGRGVGRRRVGRRRVGRGGRGVGRRGGRGGGRGGGCGRRRGGWRGSRRCCCRGRQESRRRLLWRWRRGPSPRRPRGTRRPSRPSRCASTRHGPGQGEEPPRVAPQPTGPQHRRLASSWRGPPLARRLCALCAGAGHGTGGRRRRCQGGRRARGQRGRRGVRWSGRSAQADEALRA